MTEPNGASITFENVGKAYSKSGGTTVTALEGVSLAMEPG
ncbi:MAG: methionine ABC transporter ATP-binding protein, partial [Sulfitobacter sp.]|nr:methionine ABC transporter ATP-binding protein [Sulfitobacter sp.]